MANTGTCKVEWSRPSVNFPVGFIKFSWTSTPSGVVTYTTTDYLAGRVGRFTTNPGATAPADNYDITITDEDLVDILLNTGQNRHTSTTQSVYPTVAGSAAGSGAVQMDFAGLLTFNVAAAGTSKVGQATLYYH